MRIIVTDDVLVTVRFCGFCGACLVWPAALERERPFPLLAPARKPAAILTCPHVKKPAGRTADVTSAGIPGAKVAIFILPAWRSRLNL
jgi:hypothetical protein